MRNPPRTSLKRVMGVMLLVQGALAVGATALVTRYVQDVDRTLARADAARKAQDAALAVEVRLREGSVRAWDALTAGSAAGVSTFEADAASVKADLADYASRAGSVEGRALAADVEGLHGEYTRLGLSLLARNGYRSGPPQPNDAARLARFRQLPDLIAERLHRQTALTQSVIGQADEVVRRRMSATLAAVALAWSGVILVLGVGFLALSRYLGRTAAALMQAAEALDRENLAFRITWDGSTDFAPLVARFNALQERLEAATASKRQLENGHAAVRAVNESLNTEIAASAATFKMVEKAARAWRLTFDTIDFILLTVDREGVVQRVNRAALLLLGGRFDDWIGRPLDALPAEQPWVEVNNLFRQVIADGTPRRSQVDDEEVWEVTCSGFAPEEEFIVLWARDVTRIVELQRTVVRSEAMGAMGELLAGVAHEVRNPLFAITALLDAWSLEPGIQERPFLGMLRREVMRMRQLMEELLEYGRPFSSHLEVGDLHAVAADAVGILDSAAKARKLTLRSNVSGLVRMDRARMLRVFLNLVQNAIDHSKEGDCIEVTSRGEPEGDPSELEISIRDHGPGFMPADLPKVFNPFFTRRPGGTGLGLPIVQRIVEEHGGTVTAGNHPDGGALIRVRLPLTSEAGAVTG